MSPAVQLQDLIVEVLDAKTQPCHTQPTNHRQLRGRQCARLTLECNLLGLVPAGLRGQPCHEALELTGREKRGRASTEIHEVERATLDGRQLRVQIPFATDQVQIVGHVLRILVGVDAKVTEVTSLAAERNVQIQAERSGRRRIQRGLCVCLNPSLPPNRKRRVRSHEIAADLGLIVLSHQRKRPRRGFGHRHVV